MLKIAQISILAKVKTFQLQRALATPQHEGVPSLGYQESSGNEDLIDILTRIMLYLSKVFDIKNPSFK